MFMKAKRPYLSVTVPANYHGSTICRPRNGPLPGMYHRGLLRAKEQGHYADGKGQIARPITESRVGLAVFAFFETIGKEKIGSLHRAKRGGKMFESSTPAASN